AGCRFGCSGGSVCLDGEGCGADGAVVLEVEEEAVGASAGRGGGAGDIGAGLGGAVAGFAVGVDVEVGEVAGAQGDQVIVGAEVGLKVGDRTAVPADGEGEFGRLTGVQVAVEGDEIGRASCRERWPSLEVIG